MSKAIILIINIIIGFLFAFGLFIAVYGMAYLGISITAQSFVGFLLTSPMLAVMWIETKKINDKSILFLGGPLLSISVTFPFYIVASHEPGLYKETPYVLLAFILFYSVMQVGFYYLNKKKQEIREHDKIWTGYRMKESNATKKN